MIATVMALKAHKSVLCNRERDQGTRDGSVVAVVPRYCVSEQA